MHPIFTLILAVCINLMLMTHSMLAITMRCYFDIGRVETSVEPSDLNDLKKILLDRFNLPDEPTITITTTINRAFEKEIEVDAKNFSYNDYMARYHYPKFGANKSLKSSQNK